MPRKSSYARKDRGDKIDKQSSHTTLPKQTNPTLGGVNYGSVQVVQAMETSTATGQKVPTQVIAVSETQRDPNVNTNKVVNPFGGNSSYAPKGSGVYGGL